MPDVSNLDVSLKDQLVKVDTTLPYEQVEQAIKKTGKTIKSGRVIEDTPNPNVVANGEMKPAVVA